MPALVTRCNAPMFCARQVDLGQEYCGQASADLEAEAGVTDLPEIDGIASTYCPFEIAEAGAAEGRAPADQLAHTITALATIFQQGGEA